jgi:biopolymer transport protein ExbD
LIFLPDRPRRTPLVLAGPVCCGLAAVAVALAAVWGLARTARAVPVDLPWLEPAEPLDGCFPGHVITVRRDGSLLLGGDVLTRAQIAERLQRLGSLPEARAERLVIRADAGAPFARVAELMEACRRAGLSAVHFEVEEGGGP